MTYRTDSPVLFLVFNRPETTQQVFDAIRRVEPQRLYIAADGPREDRPEDREACEAVRGIVSTVDWDCEVFTLLRDSNLGCRSAVTSAIDWFFENESEGIILEDDCLPSPDFFRFVDEMLLRYCGDRRVMSVSGTAPWIGGTQLRHSYRFSDYHLMWGWATWKRAWELNDPGMLAWSDVRSSRFLYQVGGGSWRFALRWRDLLDRNDSGDLDFWDLAWNLSCWLSSGVAIHPARNLVTNIGFGADATFLVDERDPRSSRGTESMGFPLAHPAHVHVDKRLDRHIDRDWFGAGPWWSPAPYLVAIDSSLLGGRLRSGVRSIRSQWDR